MSTFAVLGVVAGALLAVITVYALVLSTRERKARNDDLAMVRLLLGDGQQFERAAKELGSDAPAPSGVVREALQHRRDLIDLYVELAPLRRPIRRAESSVAGGREIVEGVARLVEMTARDNTPGLARPSLGATAVEWYREQLWRLRPTYLTGEPDLLSLSTAFLALARQAEQVGVIRPAWESPIPLRRNDSDSD